MSDSSDKQEMVKYEDAVKMLPVGNTIHTFRNCSPGVLIGADWGRKQILAAIKKHGCQLSGPQATNMKHGLVLLDPDPLFIETVSP